MKLEETLAALRKKQGLTQAELAEILGVSRQAVSKWEVGEAPPQKPSRRKKVVIALLLGWAAVLSISIMAGYLWWNSQPAQQFLYWNEGEASSSPISPGISLDVSVTRFSDGSGSIAYTLQNNTNDTFYFSKWVWVDYKYQGKYHCISLEPGYKRYIPASLRGDATFFIDPGETWSNTVSFPGKMLALPGQYRFCVENIGFVEFAVFEDGSVLVGK